MASNTGTDPGAGSTTGEQDLYAGTQETTEGRVFTVSGQDWDSISEGLEEGAEERVVVNMGPQHPSTHGVLRLILELEGETVTEARCGIGYLHTGIEKNMEFRSWTQGVTFCTRMDYLSPFYNEADLRARRRAAARHRGRRAREGAGHAGAPDGAQPASPRTWWPSPPAAWSSAR